MRWGDVVKLVKEVTTENSMGDVVTVRSERQIFANKKSIRQSEFYQAAATGLKPELAFDLRSMEYEDEKELEYKSKLYEIIRTYDKGEFIELICQGLVNRATS